MCVSMLKGRVLHVSACVVVLLAGTRCSCIAGFWDRFGGYCGRDFSLGIIDRRINGTSYLESTVNQVVLDIIVLFLYLV